MTCKVRYREGTGLTLGMQGKGIKNSSIVLTQHRILLAAVTMQKIKSGCSLVISELWRLGFPGAASLLARDTLSNTTCHGKCLSMPWHLTLPASELILAAASCPPSPFPKSCHSQGYLGLQHQVGLWTAQLSSVSQRPWLHHVLLLSAFLKPFLHLMKFSPLE